MIVRVKGGYRIKHTHGKKGFVDATPKPVSLKKAKAIHAAITISEAREAGHDIPVKRRRSQLRKNGWTE